MRGAIFCHVEISVAVYRFMPCKTSGYQKWAGARPSFNMIAIVVRQSAIVELVLIIDHCPV